MMDKNSRILIVGHNNVIEKSLIRHFSSEGFARVVSVSQTGLDVLRQETVEKFFKDEKPAYVFLSSVCSGGIEANQKFPAQFIYENLQAQNNVVHAAYKNGVKKLLFYAASCVYPKEGPSPIKEDSLLTGALEPTSEPYAVAKIAGIKLCQSYRRQHGFKAVVAVPATIYGPGSDTDFATAHVMGALIGKFHQAAKDNQPEVVVWGSGRPRREFLYADDFVSASLFLMERYDDPGLINAGCGRDISVKELAGIIKDVSGFKGKIVFDKTRPDGALSKLLDNRRLSKLGWKPKVGLEEGIEKTYKWYLENSKSQ
jgi:GDP-L-fucose synthase